MVGMDPTTAVTALVDRYGPRLHALALRLCGHRADAEDLVQEVFLQAFRKWDTFRGEADPGTWLHTIAARSCKARMRRKGGIDRRVPALSQLLPRNEGGTLELAMTPRSGWADAAYRESIGRVQAAVVELPEHLRLPLILKDVLGMEVLETAAALDLAENTVKTRLHRARLALRKALTCGATLVPLPPPIYDRQVCLDLLRTKLSAMDRGGAVAGFKVPRGELCAHCRAVFGELDLVQEACARLADGALPSGFRSRLIQTIKALERAQPRPLRSASPTRRPGPSPVKHSTRPGPFRSEAASPLSMDLETDSPARGGAVKSG